jgi:DNA invertase Pin-like site-specific DNA recombinase
MASRRKLEDTSMAVVYSYQRYSTSKQKWGDSLRRQVERGEKWIKRNKHTPATKPLQDLGMSAFRGKNRHKGALSQFLKSIEEGTVEKGDILLVENLDRLSREGIADALQMFLAILSAGVKIAVVRLDSEKIYDKKSVSDIAGLLEPLVDFSRAHSESFAKSERLTDLWRRMRKDRQGESPKKVEPFNKRCPSWLEWNDTKNDFTIKPHARRSIKYIFKRATEGIGQKQLVQELQEKFEPLGYSGQWNTSFLSKVMRDKAVIGELQPYTTNEDEERVKVGPPIPNYYPAVIDEGLFYRVQQDLDSRRQKRGRKGDFANLFQGIVWNARDGEKCHIATTRTKRKSGDIYLQRRLVSYGHLRKIEGADPRGFDYFAFEQHLLTYLSELDPKTLSPKKQKRTTLEKTLAGKEDELAGITARLYDYEKQMTDLKQKPPSTVVRTVANLEAKQHEVQKDIHGLKAQIAQDNDPLEGSKSIIELLGKTKDGDKHELRQRLQHHIGELIDEIWILTLPRGDSWRVDCLVDVDFADGDHRRLYMTRENVHSKNKYLKGRFRSDCHLKDWPDNREMIDNSVAYLRRALEASEYLARLDGR